MKADLLFVDSSSSGVSGDKFFSALLGLGLHKKTILGRIVKSCKGISGVRRIEIFPRRVRRAEISALLLENRVEESTIHRTAKELVDLVENCTRKLRLNGSAANYAVRVARTLAEAESKVHRQHPNRLRLHELGSLDTVIDIIGTTLSLETIGAFDGLEVYSTPLALGRGTAKFSGGLLPVPVPVVAEILKTTGFPSIGGPIEGELTTPTGAALLVNIAKPIESYPLSRFQSVGYGAGKREFPVLPNVLRVVLARSLASSFETDEVRILETNLDDVPGEYIGFALERLMDSGAKDVSIIPMFTKKNRPGHILRIIADPSKVDELSKILIQETGTLGIREMSCRRHLLFREEQSMPVRVGKTNFEIMVKIARDSQGRILRVKPEFEDLRKIALKMRIGLREAESLVMGRAQKKLL